MTNDAPVAPAPLRHSRRVRRGRLARYAGYGAAWVLFVTVARLIVPQSSHASEGTGAVPMLPANPASTGRDLGTLVGREYIVRLVATSGGPRYTVCSLDGTVLHENLDAAELAESFPMLDPGMKQADPTRLMSADTGE